MSQPLPLLRLTLCAGWLGRRDRSFVEIANWSRCSLGSCCVQHTGNGTWYYHSHCRCSHHYLDRICYWHVQIEPPFSLRNRRRWWYHLWSDRSRIPRNGFLPVLAVRLRFCYAWSIHWIERRFFARNLHSRLRCSGCCNWIDLRKRSHAWPH